MQRKVTLVKWGFTILALLIMMINTLVAGQLVTRASASVDLNDRPSCQLIKGTGGDTQLTLSKEIPDQLSDLLGADNGPLKFSLQCTQTPKGAPCIETSPTKCVPTKKGKNPKPPTNPTPPSTPPTTPPTTPPSNPNAPNVTCGLQNVQLVCTVTGPNGMASPVTCGLQSGQIACNGSGLIPLLSSIVGMPLPPNGAVSCGYQKGQLGCTGGSTPSPNSFVTCQFQNGQASCNAPVPQNLSVTVPSISGNVGCQQSQKGAPIICTIPGLPPLVITPSGTSGTSSSSIAGILQTPDQQAAMPSCELVTGADQGNTSLTLSSKIGSALKGLLEKQDGTLKFSLLCNM